MTDFHESDQLRRDKIRRRKQKGYQAGYRKRLKCGRVPDREDMWPPSACGGSCSLGEPARCGQALRQAVLDDLASRFRREQAEKVLDAMIHHTRETRQRRRA
jgi:hypothetical protein